MTLRYQTGIATLTQLIIMLLLNFANAVGSSITACSQHSGCISNIVVSSMFVIVLAIWLLLLSAIGYQAQEKRSSRFATLLIAGEALVVVVAIFDIRHFPNILGLITSLIDCALGIWVIILAWRLRQAGGGRIVIKASSRARRRPVQR